VAFLERFRRTRGLSAPEPMAYVLQPDGHVMSVKAYGNNYALQAYGSLSSLPLSGSAEGYAVAYLASVWAYRAIELRVDAIARLPFTVLDTRTKKAIPDHPLLTALTRSKRIIPRTERTRLLYGETFLWPRANAYGYRYDIVWLNNLGVDIDTSQGYITEFYYHPIQGGQSLKFKPSDLAYMYTDNPFDDLRGLSPLESVLTEIGIDREQARTMRNFYANDARPGLLLLPKKQLQPAQAQPLIDWWKDNFQGSKNAGKPAIMPFDIEDVKEFQRAPMEDDVMVAETIQKKIAAALDVPLPMLIGLSEATYDSANDIRKSFYEETVIPACEALAEEYNRELLPFFGDPARETFAFQYDTILALMENRAEKATIANSRLSAGGITLNEYRRDAGLPTLDKGDVFYIPLGLQQVHVSAIGQSYTQQPALPAPDVTIETPPPDDTPTKDAGHPLYISLSLAGNVDLQALQQRLKALYADTIINWSKADDYHVTLLYAPSANAQQIDAIHAALKQVSVPEMALSIGSLRTFDTVGEHALHFRIRRNTDLLTLQEQIYDLAQQEGVASSAYSIPERYIPHVTMGYCTEKVKSVIFDGKLSVQPDALMLYAGDDLLEHIPVDIPRQTPDDELQAWEKKAINKGATKSFVNIALRDGIADGLRERLAACVDKATIKAAFAWAHEELSEDHEVLTLWPSVKAYRNTRAAFVDEMLRIIGAAQKDDTSRRQFAGAMRAALRRYGLVAFRDGMNQAGYDPESLGDKELKSFREWQAEQSAYVTGFGAEIFRAGITEAQVQQRAYMWADVSLEDARLRGIEAADAGLMMEWVLGQVQEEHCDDCPKLAGTIQPISVWRKSNVLPGSGKTECKQGCQCTLMLRKGAKAVGSIDWIKAHHVPH